MLTSLALINMGLDEVVQPAHSAIGVEARMTSQTQL